jgi:hypothetical protein
VVPGCSQKGPGDTGCRSRGQGRVSVTEIRIVLSCSLLPHGYLGIRSDSMKITKSLALLSFLLLAGCASTTSTAYVDPTLEDRDRLIALYKPYYGCMLMEAMQFKEGGASMELALETATTKCSPQLAGAESYAYDRRIHPAYMEGARARVLQNGRVRAVEFMTQKRPQQTTPRPTQ